MVQAALKLVLEPIFEADFVPVSYGFRPRRRPQDAIADIHRLGTQGYKSTCVVRLDDSQLASVDFRVVSAQTAPSVLRGPAE